jgi:AraC family transcriptional regulator of adaptative response/methylated-DNA-[protein]-cysteine methyltransferase
MALDKGRPPQEADWSALLARLPYRGVYAVKTTGIACRFGCPSRRPLRRNVEIFDNLTDAIAAGYRPCLRCRP